MNSPFVLWVGSARKERRGSGPAFLVAQAGRVQNGGVCESESGESSGGAGAMAVEIIGRREELLVFAGFLTAVPAGGQALLLEGDAGIGKSALWQEGKRLAGERSFRVLASRSAHSETRIAFATIGDLFAPVFGGALPRLATIASS